MQVSIQAFHKKLMKGEINHWIDVRSVAEFKSERADCAITVNHPLDQINTLNLPKSATIYLSCRSGVRSSKAQKALRNRGFNDVINIDGGYLAWQQANYPVTKTQGQFPIMRQVQIIAGLLILIGSLGSIFLIPELIWLAVFVGAGLSFAGLSGWCGMTTVLSIMPWNKKASS
ncbi:MAG: DUF2892 domain-containing protein [Mariprofundaceae bacterium]|nr:DUF2892 domain-containing protein [Mariprofundaceae bacterium]